MGGNGYQAKIGPVGKIWRNDLKHSLVFALSLVGACALAQVDSGRVVATVNGEEIRGSEYYRRMEYLPGVGKLVGEGRVAEFPPGFMTLEQLITERLITQLAKEKGVSATPAEAEQELRNRLEENPKLLEDWTSTGQTREELLYQIQLELNQFKVLTFGINVTDQEVDEFYAKNPEIFTIPRRVTLRVIAVPTVGDREAVDADLKAGKTFADVAKARSMDITKSTGGEYGTVPITALNEQVRTAIGKVKIGETTEWLSTTDAQVKFLLEGVVPETKQPMSPILKRQTRQRMMLDKGRVKNDIQALMADMRKKANIDIKQKEFAEAYRQFINAYLSQRPTRSGG
jgi:foldase protein PrsA